MVRGVPRAYAREEAIRLRVEERKSLGEIELQLGVSKGSLSLWLREYPLTDIERRDRRKLRLTRQVKVELESESKLQQALKGRELTRQQKGRLAETAALLRLILHGFNPLTSPFEGDPVDFFVEVPETRRVLRLQVKWASVTFGSKLPSVSLRCTEGHNKSRSFREGECDILVGYYLRTDTAYVWSWEDLNGVGGRITTKSSYAEAWWKLRE